MSRAATVAALAALVLAADAHAEAASSARVRALAARAAHGDGAALAELRRVDVVDGRPMRLARVLRGADVDSRLAALAGGAPAGARGGDARAAAKDILAQRRYRGSRVPRPFHGVLVWIGDKIRSALRPVDDALSRLPGGRPVGWAILGGIVIALAAFVALRSAQRRGGRHLERAEAALRSRMVDPAELEHEADAAERAGDAELALRLRFRAGLLRLGRAKVIPQRDSITTGEVRRILRSSDFDRLARTFDAVVYGRRTAAPADVADARESWPRVLQAAGAR